MKRGRLLFATVFAAALFLAAGITGQCEVHEGRYGANITWRVEDGVMTFSGTGKLEALFDIKWEELNEENEYEEMKYTNPWEKYDEPRIKKVVIDEGITEVADPPFATDMTRVEVQLPDSLEVIGDHAFSVSPSLPIGVRKVDIPENVRYIGKSAFAAAPIEEIHIPKNVTHIEKNALRQMASLKKITVSEDNPMFTTVDGALCTKDMTRLLVYPSGSDVRAEFKIPEGVKEIDEYAFYCAKIVNLTLPESLTSLPAHAFSSAQIDKMYIPKSVTTAVPNTFDGWGWTVMLRTYAFGTCINNIYYAGSKADWVRIWEPDMKNGESYEEFEKRKFYNFQTVIPAIHCEEISICVNGKYIESDIQPIIKNDRTLAPMRDVFEALGAEAVWNNDERAVIGKKDGKTVKIKADEAAMYVNGEKVLIGCAVETVDGRTFVPVRAAAEALGAGVNWDNDKRCVTITG